MTASGLTTFLVVSLLVICTPGQDTALTVRNTLVGGRRSGLWTAGGVAGLLRASEPAFLAVKIIGVGYLLFLAVQAFHSAWRGRYPDAMETGHDHRRALRQGLISNLALYSCAVVWARGVLRRRRVRRILDAVAGSVFAYLGARLART